MDQRAVVRRPKCIHISTSAFKQIESAAEMGADGHYYLKGVPVVTHEGMIPHEAIVFYEEED